MLSLEYLEQLFSTDISLQLIRSDNASLTISFLYKAFNASEKLIQSYDDIRGMLESYLDDLDPGLKQRYSGTAAYYIDQWCNQQHRYLRKYYDSDGHAVLEPTKEIEQVFEWLRELKAEEFIGTESRFLRIFEALKDIINNTTADPEEKLASLKNERDMIDRQIKELEKTQSVELFSSTQIKERFSFVINEARRLVSDFREVEDNFKEVTRVIQESNLQEDAHRGSIVRFVLEADDALKGSDQGKSFYAFWNFLLSPVLQDELREMIHKIYTLPEFAENNQADPFLKQLKFHLLEAGDKVLRSNHRLSGQLRKTLDEQNRIEQKRVAEILKDIRRFAISMRDEPPSDRSFYQIEIAPDIEFIMDRPWWSPKKETELAAMLEEFTEPVELKELFNQFYIDQKELNNRITFMLQEKSPVTLHELLESYPLSNGLPELLTYYHIAAIDPRHRIDDEQSITIVLDGPQSEKANRIVSAPELIFTR